MSSKGGAGSGNQGSGGPAGQGENGEHDKNSGGRGGSATQPESFSAGPRRLLDVRFSPDGNALYVADLGTGWNWGTVTYYGPLQEIFVLGCRMS